MRLVECLGIVHDDPKGLDLVSLRVRLCDVWIVWDLGLGTR